MQGQEMCGLDGGGRSPWWPEASTERRLSFSRNRSEIMQFLNWLARGIPYIQVPKPSCFWMWIVLKRKNFWTHLITENPCSADSKYMQSFKLDASGKSLCLEASTRKLDSFSLKRKKMQMQRAAIAVPPPHLFVASTRVKYGHAILGCLSLHCFQIAEPLL